MTTDDYMIVAASALADEDNDAPTTQKERDVTVWDWLMGIIIIAACAAPFVVAYYLMIRKVAQ